MSSINTCPECEHTQLDGKFCAECGASFLTLETREPIEYPPAKVDDSLEKLARETKAFMRFLSKQFKAPSGHFHTTAAKLQNSILSIVLFIILTAIALYRLSLEPGVPALQLVSYFSIFFLLLFVINIIANISTARLFSEPETLSELTRKLGGFYAIPIALSFASFLLTFTQSYPLASILLSISLILAFILIPLFTITLILIHHQKSIDGFHGILFYLSMTIVGGILLVVFFEDTPIRIVLRFLTFHYS